MKFSIQEITPDCYQISKGEVQIGTVEVRRNPAHNQNIYLSLAFTIYPLDISQELFSWLYNRYNRHLQVMLESTKQEIADFLVAGGFRLARKCFERDFSLSDCIRAPMAMMELHTAQASSPVYSLCAELLYQQYQAKHTAINPLTEDFEIFSSTLPDFIYYDGNVDHIVSFAFMEANEIAYVGTVDSLRYCAFIETVVSVVFAEYDTLSFEADDCDWEAMVLKNLFTDPCTESYDTYIY